MKKLNNAFVEAMKAGARLSEMGFSFRPFGEGIKFEVKEGSLVWHKETTIIFDGVSFSTLRNDWQYDNDGELSGENKEVKTFTKGSDMMAYLESVGYHDKATKEELTARRKERMARKLRA